MWSRQAPLRLRGYLWSKYDVTFMQMNAEKFAESDVEEATLAWLESLGYSVEHGPEFAQAEIIIERPAETSA